MIFPKRLIWSLLLSALLLLPLFSQGSWAYQALPSKPADEITDKERQLREVLEQKRAEEEKIQQLLDSEKSTMSDIEAANLQIYATEQQLSILNLQLEDLQIQISSLTTRIADEEAALAKRQALFNDHLKMTYREGRVSSLEMLLSSSSFADFTKRVNYLATISSEDERLAQEIKANKENLKTQKAALDAKYNEVATVQAQVQDRKNQLDAQRASLQAMLDKIQGDKAEAEAQQAQHAAEAAALESEIADLLKQRGDIPPYTGPVFSGSLVWPVNGYVSQPYSGWHHAIDIAAPMYTPIFAAASGTVISVGHMADGCELVLISHGGGLVTSYAHVDDRIHPPVVSAGDTVTAGEIIAFIGMTGVTTGPHLHFSVSVDGGNSWVDPMLFL